jgi:hypothetical protein
MTPDPLTTLRQAILDGEAMLILGQDHTPGFVDSVLRDANSLLTLEAVPASLPELYARLADTPGKNTIDALLKASPSIGLLEVASLPWTAVLTTAVDTTVLAAMRGAGGQRRVVEVSSAQLASILHLRSTQVLHLVRAFGSVDGAGETAVPDSAQALTRRRMLELPQVVSQLARLVGLRGVVVVDGVSDRDWLGSTGLEMLCLAFQQLPQGRVFWFDANRVTLPSGNLGIHVEELPLSEHLKLWLRDSGMGTAVQAARERVFGVGDRVLTLRGPGLDRTVVIGAKEWRDVNRIGQLLDDDSLVQLRSEHTEGREGLVRYLRQSHAGVPEWRGPAKRYIFERRVVGDLIDDIVAFIEGPKASILSDSHQALPRRVPYMLSGPPASGKTVGLLHAAWQLRNTKQLCVLWLVPGVAGIDVVAIERVCRTLEQRGVRWSVLFADGLEMDEYIRVHQRLSAAGRRVVVVGTESTSPFQQRSAVDVKRFELTPNIEDEELRAFQRYLTSHKLHSHETTTTSDFLRLLCGVVPEIQFGALPSLLEEYERVVSVVRQTAESVDDVPGTALGQQLRKLFPELIDLTGDGAPKSKFDADKDLRQLLHLILFTAQLERPLPVDIALSVLGGGVLGKFPSFEAAFEKTALVQDVALDQEGTRGFTTAHQLHAEWLLQGLVPRRAKQLDLLEQLALGIRWLPDAFPGDNPPQDYVLDLLKTVGPRGRFARFYNFKAGLERLATVISEVRQRFVMEQPRLLALEALILGDLAQMDSEERDTRLGRCTLALQLLGRAEDILQQRRPSEARNFELQRTLTQAADIRGTMINIWLRQPGDGGSPNVTSILEELKLIERDAMRARSYDAQYHPIDIVCWSHRDAVDWLPEDVDQVVRESLIGAMESALDVAEEEVVRDPEQLSRYEEKRVQVAERRRDWQVSEALAQRMREKGDFAGEVSISRYRVKDDADPSACLTELLRFWKWRPEVFRSLYAVRHMQKLWTRVFLRERLGEGDPKRVAATSPEWGMLADVCRARLSFEEDQDQPFTLFMLGWSLYQLDEPKDARRVFERLERQSLGMARRVGELAYLTDATGRPRSYEGQVVHARPAQVKIRVPALDVVIDLRPEVETRMAPAGFRMGEIIDISVALNYRGITLAPAPSRS